LSSLSVLLNLGVEKFRGPAEEVKTREGEGHTRLSPRLSSFPYELHLAAHCLTGVQVVRRRKDGGGQVDFGFRREGGHLSDKRKSPSLRAGTFCRLLTWVNSLIICCPEEEEVKNPKCVQDTSRNFLPSLSLRRPDSYSQNRAEAYPGPGWTGSGPNSR
jgi:hypothetical protein